MRLTLALLAATVLFAGCKRKLKEVTPEGALAKYAAHCYNSAYDSTEVGLDCGGDCSPCSMITPSCSPAVNTLAYSNTELPVIAVSKGGSNGYYECKASSSMGDIVVRFGGSAPDPNRSYLIDDFSQPLQGYAYVGLGSMIATEEIGRVYLNFKDGKTFVVVCGARFYSWSAQTAYENCSIGILFP